MSQHHLYQGMTFPDYEYREYPKHYPTDDKGGYIVFNNADEETAYLEKNKPAVNKLADDKKPAFAPTK